MWRPMMRALDVLARTGFPPRMMSGIEWDSMVEEEGGIRLQKALAQAGVASRRTAENLIEQGRVEVDGQVVTEFGTRVDPAVSVIRVDGERIPPITAHVYMVLNKPRGVVTTMSDPQGRPCVADYVHDRPERLFHIGRLDTDTEGLLLLTNHGEFAHRLAHPSYEVSKTYVAEVEGNVKPAVLRTPARRRRNSTTARPRPTPRSRCPASRAAPWCRSLCTRAATGSSAGCSTPSVTRSNA